ncbi:hypothetical protein M9H77_30228 [Catharanthus roseus]|uniref:Uncharacterized protein n=1 Tax=Catharanthus roseus TaxID=4058 RepID=A0ACC0A0K1_CATRO|nr:hypothetical protein M9H77_30228 [Catharanthus roseus]
MNTKWASLRVEVGWQAFDAGRVGLNPTRPVCLFVFCVTLRDSFSAGLCRLTFVVPCVWLELFLRPLVSLRDSRHSSPEEHSLAVLRCAHRSRTRQTRSAPAAAALTET